MASNIVDEIFFKIGFEVKDDKVKDVDHSVKNLIKSVTAFVGTIALITTALDRMANSLAKNNQEFINFNRQTGLSITQMQKLATVGMLTDYNFSPETAMQGIQALQSNLAQIRLGQGNIAPFQILGISPVGKDAYQIIEDLREAIKGIDDMTAVNLIQQMGLSPEFISLLRMTREEMEALADPSLMLSPEERQSLQQYTMELRKMHMQFSVLKDRAINPLMPALNNFLGGLNAFFEIFVKIEHALINVWNWFGKFKGVIVGLGIALGLAGKLNFAIKVLGVTFNIALGKWLAILTAVYLILEDIAVWATGGKSFLGTTFEKIGEFFNNLKMPDWLTNTIDKLTNFFGKAIDFFSNDNIPEKLKGLFGYDSQPALAMATAGGSMANMNTTNTINQNNTFYTNEPVPEKMAQQTVDLAFAYAQVDRTV